MHTFWNTFYSYKGGVGRSMALANVAAHLAATGRRVMMIDFDLEAPGLDSFEEFAVPPGKAGLVEYVCHYLETGQPARIDDFIHEIRPEEGAASGNGSPRSFDGKLWLMTSGAKNENYNQKRLSIDWANLYENRAGAQFFENFKAEIEDTYKPDYVLVDSRTGLTDVGGVCTLHLPDLVVLLFALNEQNLQGIASVAQVLRNSEKLPQLIPVATPVPNIQGGKDSPLDQRYMRAKELLGTEVTLSLPYSAGVALKEKILTWVKPTPLGAKYQELAHALQNADPAGIDFLQREAKAAIESMDMERADEIGRFLESEYGDRPDSWLTLADIAMANRDPEAMEKCLRQSLTLSPDNQRVFERIVALMRGRKRHEELLDLIKELLKTEQARPSFATQLYYNGAELQFRAGRSAEALSYIEAGLAMARPNGEKGGDENLVANFNCAEARRRATGEIRIDEWKRLIAVFEDDSVGLSAQPLPTRANHTQSIHIAYACVGDLERAKAMLDETAKLLTLASRQERVFCVADYDYLPLGRFLERNRQMREALDRGELWDGMALPVRD